MKRWSSDIGTEDGRGHQAGAELSREMGLKRCLVIWHGGIEVIAGDGTGREEVLSAGILKGAELNLRTVMTGILRRIMAGDCM